MASAALPPSRNALGLRGDEMAGLVIAGLAHVVIVAALAINALRAPAVIPPPERVTVSLAEDVGLEATAAQISTEGQASVSDRIGEVPVPPKPELKAPAPPKPVAKTPKKPVVSIDASSTRRTPAPKPTPSNAGGSRIGDDFLGGKGNNPDSDAPIPASQIGAAEKASLVQAISREIRPQWQGRSPQGLDADRLVTVLSFNLNPDGTLAGTPQVVRQDGITDSNRAQAGRHAEIAISAVQRAAPFKLPKEYYNAWKKISAFRFDRNLSQ